VSDAQWSAFGKPGPVVLVGAGELGRDAMSVFAALERVDPRWTVVGFVDDDPASWNREVLGRPVLGGLDWLATRAPDTQVLLTVGRPATRVAIEAKLAPLEVAYATAVHPSVAASPWVRIGEGSLVMAGCTFTVDVTVGRHVVINPGCTIAHDVRIGDHCYVSPGVDLAGTVVVEREAYLGTGAVVIPGCTIGAGATIGAGGVVIRDVRPAVTAVGVPTRVLEDR
jgi:sugar O-acyltransferase (sialic acid O-acetyltransferase NeuD family)